MDVALENVPQGDCRRCNARKRGLRANLSGKRTEMNLFANLSGKRTEMNLFL